MAVHASPPARDRVEDAASLSAGVQPGRAAATISHGSGAPRCWDVSDAHSWRDVEGEHVAALAPRASAARRSRPRAASATPARVVMQPPRARGITSCLTKASERRSVCAARSRSRFGSVVAARVRRPPWRSDRADRDAARAAARTPQRATVRASATTSGSRAQSASPAPDGLAACARAAAPRCVPAARGWRASSRARCARASS
jgi:hypothetical protein